jgi:hypothetical protein
MVGTTKPVTFERMHRKQQAELLVHELSKAVGLVLSLLDKIWLCPPGVMDLLGWQDKEFIGGNLADLVHGA